MRTKRQSKSLTPAIPRRPVFTLDSLAETIARPNAREAARERVKYHVAEGRLKVVSRGVYATVPSDVDPRTFVPDRYLAAAAVRADAMFSHHAALELLGAAHSDWNVCTVLTERRRSPLALGSVRVLFLSDPPPFRTRERRGLGTREVERQGVDLRVTGPERTLLDGFRQPRFVGGLAELVESVAGLGVLDLDLLERLLEVYDQRMLHAAAGWFLERFRDRFFVSDAYLAKLERQRPRSRQYLPRGRRKGGVVLSRWNLVMPEAVTQAGEPGGA